MELKVALIHKAKDPQGGPDRWYVEVSDEHGTFGTPYSKGIGLRAGHDKWQALYKPGTLRNSIWQWEKFSLLTKPVDPTLDEVLESLAADASCYEESRDIDDFRANFNPDGKISEVQDQWEACRKALRFFTDRRLDWQDFTEEAREAREASAGNGA